MYSDRSCIIKHTASVPLPPLGNINLQFENQKQTKLKAPSHCFVCKKDTECCIWSHHELVECVHPTVPAYYFLIRPLFRQKAKEILECEVCCTHTQSFPSLVILTALVAGTGIGVETDMGCSRLLLALLCLSAFNVVLEPHSWAYAVDIWIATCLSFC